MKEFSQIPAPDSKKSYKEIVDECNKRRFQFPGFENGAQNHLERQDERSDSIFYETPRFVTHIDDFAIEKLLQYYENNLENESKIIDLCSSWISHLPNSVKFESVIGIGMNKKELKANKRLSKYHVLDLNKKPKLDMVESDSIDAVLCTVSVDYLIRVSDINNFIIF